jgi:hypothetical protein
MSEESKVSVELEKQIEAAVEENHQQHLTQVAEEAKESNETKKTEQGTGEADTSPDESTSSDGRERGDGEPGQTQGDDEQDTGEGDPGDKDGGDRESEGDDDGGDIEGSSDHGSSDDDESAGLTPATLQAAVLAGIPLVTAQTFPNEQALQSAVATIEATKKQAFDDMQRQITETLDGQEDEPEEEYDPLEGVDLDEYDETSKKLLSTMADALKNQQKQIAALQGSVKDAATVGLEAGQREVEVWFDSRVESLGADYEEALGKGASSALTQGSPQSTARNAIADRIAVMLSGYEVLGQVPPPRDQLFQEATRLVLGDSVQKSERQKLQKRLSRRKRQHLNRGTNKGSEGDAKTARDEIAAKLDEKFFNK